MPLIGPMLLLIFENLWAYALIQDYAFIRTLRLTQRKDLLSMVIDISAEFFKGFRVKLKNIFHVACATLDRIRDREIFQRKRFMSYVVKNWGFLGH